MAPLSLFTTIITLLWQPENRRWCATSMDSPDGPSHVPSGHVFTSVFFRASIATTSFLSSMLK